MAGCAALRAIIITKTGKDGEQIQMTTDTMIKGESTKFSVCSLPLSIMLMHLNPNPNPNADRSEGS